MKQANYSGRPRGRSSDRPKQSQKHPNGESRENRSRGNPQQFVDKYLSLARDAASLGDPVSTENFYQYADHYYRLAAENRALRSPTQRPPEKKEEPVPTPEGERHDNDH